MIQLNGELKPRLFQYFILFLVLILGVGAFLYFSERFTKVLLLLATSAVYILWGILHHWLTEDLHIRVVLEYLLIAILVDVVILSLLFWA